MVFTKEDEQRPKVAHDEGLPCVVMEASQWRGPDKRYCSKSKCKKAATAARRAAKGSSWEERLKDAESEIEAFEERLTTLEDTLERRFAGYEKQLAEQAKELENTNEIVATLQNTVLRLSHQLLNAKPLAAGAKRPALAGLAAQPPQRG